MIIDLPATTTAAINRSMVDLRERGGTIALGRVLTLVIVTGEDTAEDAIAAANTASFEHPCRVVVIRSGDRTKPAGMDAQIRVGGDAGASEVIVLNLTGELAEHGASGAVPLLLPDTPVVVWWPGRAPDEPATDPIGALAGRRITDLGRQRDPVAALAHRARGHRSGDTDLTWTRLTQWRGLLAAALDADPAQQVTGATVLGAADSVSTDLLAGWLAVRLGCPVRRGAVGADHAGMHSVVLDSDAGPVSLTRPEASTATLTIPGQPDRGLALPRRTLPECIAEELRRLDADEVYAEALIDGVPRVEQLGATD